MTKILLAVYLNNLVRILWKEVLEESARLENGGRPFSNVYIFAIFTRAILWPLVIIINAISIFIKGLPKKKSRD